MGNNPVFHTDPSGEVLPAVAVAAIWGAAIAGVTDTASVGFSDGGFDNWEWGEFGKSVLVGAATGTVTAGVANGMSLGIGTAQAGGSFGAGFTTGVGTSVTGGFASFSTLTASSSFLTGVAIGGTAGFAGGFTAGSLNTGLSGGSFGYAMSVGLRKGLAGAVTGGVIGGFSGGIKAMRDGRTFIAGREKFNLSQGVGAHFDNGSVGAPFLKGDGSIKGKYVGKYEGVNVYESKPMGRSGITFPGRGIVVGKGAYSQRLDMSLMRREFGHVLQARHFGMSAFYGNIGPSSLWSATKATFEIGNHSHGAHWTEVLANKLSYKYFNQPSNWPTTRFPLTFKNYDWLPGFLGY